MLQLKNEQTWLDLTLSLILTLRCFEWKKNPSHAWKPDLELTVSFPTSRPSFQLNSNPSGRSRKFTVHFSKPLLPNAAVSFNHILLLRGVASVSAAFWNCVRVCVVQVMMSVKHREHVPSPDWWTRGCKHQHRVMRSMLLFMKSLCLLIVPCAWPASLLLLIPTPQQPHNNHLTIPPLLCFFLV